MKTQKSPGPVETNYREKGQETLKLKLSPASWSEKELKIKKKNIEPILFRDEYGRCCRCVKILLFGYRVLMLTDIS